MTAEEQVLQQQKEEELRQQRRAEEEAINVALSNDDLLNQTQKLIE